MSDTPVGDILDDVIGQLLNIIPDVWTEYDPARLTDSQERALYLLTAAGMVGRRMRFRLRMFGQSVPVEATISLTGEGGLAEAMESMAAGLWDEWREAFLERKAGDLKDAPAFLCERIGKDEWRLTSEGILARGDLATGNQARVLDFVLKRGFFDGQPRMMPDGQIRRREPVRGKGITERMQKVPSEASVGVVNIANWGEGGQAFAAAFERLMGSSPRATEPAPVTPPKPKRSTGRGNGRAKLIAALTKHHKYADGGCLNLEPIGNNELAKASRVSRSTASAFFNKEFQGYSKYTNLCRDTSRLVAALKLLNGEFSPQNLYGRRPPDEDDREDE